MAGTATSGLSSISSASSTILVRGVCKIPGNKKDN